MDFISTDLVRNMQTCGFQHTGTILAITDQQVMIRVEQFAACAACHSKEMCTASDKKDHIIYVDTPKATQFKVGEKVSIISSNKSVAWAIVWAYVLPVILVIISIAATVHFLQNETLAAGIGLGICIIYALFLYLVREKLGRKVKIEIEKLTA